MPLIGNISGSHTHLADGTSFLLAGTNVTITSGSGDTVTISATGGVDTSGSPADNQIAIWTDADTLEGTSTLTYDGTTISLNDAVTINDAGGDNDFRVESNNKEYAIVVDASTDQVLILSGGAQQDPLHRVHLYTDTNFYVSGTIGSRGTSTRGTAVFGGDVYSSGSVHIDEGQYLLTDGIKHYDATHTQVIFSDNIVTLTSHGPNLQLEGASTETITMGDSSAGGNRFSVFSHNRSNQEFVLLMSGGSDGWDYNGADYPRSADVAFYVSGAVGGMGGSLKTTSVFAGDTLVSGVLKVGGQNFHHLSDPAVGGTISGSIHHTSGGLSYLVAGSNVTIVSGANGQVTIASTGGGGGGGISFDGSTANGVLTFKDSDEATVESNLTFDGSTLTLTGDASLNGAITINEDGADKDFRVESAGKENAVLVDANTNQVLILSGGDDESFNEAAAADVNFYVSGSLGSAGTGVRGTSVFGGDAVVSGAIHVGGGTTGITALRVTGNIGNDYVTIIDNKENNSGHALRLKTAGNGVDTYFLNMEDGDGDTLFRARADGRFGFGANGVSSMGAGTFVVGIDGGHNSDIAISKRLQHLGDSNTFMDFPAADRLQFVVGGKNVLSASTDQVLILSGGGAKSFHEAAAADVAFYVSGTKGSQGHNVRGTAVFGGDTFVSGALTVGTPPGQSTDGSTYDFIVNTQNLPGAIKVDGSADSISFAGMSDSSGQLQPGQDAFFWVSGSLSGGTSGKDSNGVAVFGGDVVVSGTLWGGNNPAAGGASILMQRADIHVVQGGAIPGILGSDTALYVSGTPGSLGHNVRGTTVFGGDAFVSGGMVVGIYPGASSDGSLQDFVVNSKDSPGIITVSGQNNRVQFQTSDSSGQLSIGQDTFFHVSGTVGGKMSGGGVAAFGGDVAVSGTIAGGAEGLTLGGGGYGSPVAIGTWFNASHVADNIGDDATIILSGNVDGAFSGGNYFGVTAVNADVVLSGNLIGKYGDHQSELRLIGSPIVASPYWGAGEHPGSDVAAFFSGSAGSMNSKDSAGTFVVGGDMFVTGGLSIGTVPRETANPTPNMDFSVNTSNYAGRLFVDGSEDHVVVGRYGDQGSSTSIGADTLFHISGTIDPMDGSNVGSDSVTAFGGDVILSGALVGTRIGNDGDQALGLKAGSNGYGTLQGYAGHVRLESFSPTGGPMGSDIYLSVSGVLGSAKQPQTYGSAVFGGDMVVSGGIYTEMGIETTKDFSEGTQYQLPVAGMTSGENLVFSPGANDTLTAGKIYFLHTDGTWNETDANDVADGAGSMLGVGRGGPSQAMGVLTRGYVRIPASLYNGTFATGSAVYVSDNATGEWDFTAPAGSGDYVRVVGYGVEALHGGTTDIVVYFNPSNDYVEIA